MKLERLIKIHLHETSSNVRIGKYLSETIPVQNGVRYGEHLTLLPRKFFLPPGTRQIQENHEGVKMNDTCHVLVSVVGVVLLVGRMNSVWENRERIMGV